LAFPVQGAACWAAVPESYEIFNDDGSMVFVFSVSDEYSEFADAAVYNIIDGDRRLVYNVEKLSSFSYENSFRFSDDMMHFIRIFPPSGMPAFEVFSNGILTKTVMRNEFIKDYSSIKAESSIGPLYTVTWNIDKLMSDNVEMTINTDEGTVIFNLVTHKFSFENESPVSFKISSVFYSIRNFFSSLFIRN